MSNAMSGYCRRVRDDKWGESSPRSLRKVPMSPLRHNSSAASTLGKPCYFLATLLIPGKPWHMMLPWARTLSISLVLVPDKRTSSSSIAQCLFV